MSDDLGLELKQSCGRDWKTDHIGDWEKERIWRQFRWTRLATTITRKTCKTACEQEHLGKWSAQCQLHPKSKPARGWDQTFSLWWAGEAAPTHRLPSNSCPDSYKNAAKLSNNAKVTLVALHRQLSRRKQATNSRAHLSSLAPQHWLLQNIPGSAESILRSLQSQSKTKKTF